VEQAVYALNKAEVPSSYIGELVMERLRSLDHIAYIRFASVYRAFADVDELEQELAALKAGWRRPDVPLDQLALLPEAEAKPPRPRLLRVRRPEGCAGESAARPPGARDERHLRARRPYGDRAFIDRARAPYSVVRRRHRRADRRLGSTASRRATGTSCGGWPARRRRRGWRRRC
jgi:hypothetical protein